MFDSFDDDYENEVKTKRRARNAACEYESDDEDDPHVNKKNKCFDLNGAIEYAFNEIVNQPLNVLNSSQRIVKKNASSLKEKLFNLYIEESQKFNFSTAVYHGCLNYSTNLLEKLVQQEQLNTLVLNFYPTNKGYSLGFNIKSNNATNKQLSEDMGQCGSEALQINSIETKCLSYDESELLYYINAGEIPPIIIDLVDRLSVNLFHDGCIIMEIRDYRRHTDQTNGRSHELHFVLLQPSMQTLLADLNSITNDGNFIWTQEDKYALESQLILATAQPLCLNPKPIVSIIKHKVLAHKYKLNDRLLKKSIYKYSNPYLNRSAKWQEFALPLPFQILKIRKKFSKTNEYLHFQTSSSKPVETKLNDALIKDIKLESSFLITSLDFQSVDNWAKNEPTFKLPCDDMILVKKFAKTHDKPRYSSDNTLISIEQLILEAIDKLSKNNYSKLLIKRQSDDDVYFCQLSLRPDQSNDVLFRLGFANEAEKYIQQYIKIFTEEGRRPVTIKHHLIQKNNLNTLGSLMGNQKSNFLNDLNSGLTSESQVYSMSSPSAFTTFSTPASAAKLKQAKSGLNGISFQSYFNKKNKTDITDKQVQTYQNFLYQQQQQSELNKKQQMQTQKQLHNQIKRIKSLSESRFYNNNGEPQNNNNNNNNNNTSKIEPEQENTIKETNENQKDKMPIVETPIKPPGLTRVYSKHSRAKSAKVDSVTTTSANSVEKFSTGDNLQLQFKPTPVSKPVQTSKSLKAAKLTNLQSNGTPVDQKNQNKDFVQIYVPKIASQMGTNSPKIQIVTTSPSVSKSAATINNVASTVAGQGTRRIAAKKRANAASAAKSTSNKSISLTEIATLNTAGIKNHQTTHISSNINTVIAAKPPQTDAVQTAMATAATNCASIAPKQIITASTSNTKIINASNLNLMRKIAIDNRSMPVIVTLNSSDKSDLSQQQAIHQQLKMKSQSQHQNKQIKLINNSSRIMLRPAFTNTNININENTNENIQTLNGTDTIVSRPAGQITSPMKTFQMPTSRSTLLKQGPITTVQSSQFNQVSVTVPSLNILNTTSITPSTHMDFSNAPPTDISAAKFLVTTLSNQGNSSTNPQMRPSVSSTITTPFSFMNKPASLVIKKLNDNNEKADK